MPHLSKRKRMQGHFSSSKLLSPVYPWFHMTYTVLMGGKIHEIKKRKWHRHCFNNSYSSELHFPVCPWSYMTYTVLTGGKTHEVSLGEFLIALELR